MARSIEVLDHPNADLLALAKVDDFVSVIAKDSLKTGDVVIYLQEGSILPDKIIQELGLEGKLAGGTVLPDGKKLRDRVKAVRLRGTLSQGICFAPRNIELQEGTDYAETLGVIKYQPPIPMEMSGAVEHKPGLLSYTEIENVKRYPNVLLPGEKVVASEKLHGTCSVMGVVGGEFVVSSKGLAKQQLGILETEGNIYWRMAREHAIEAKLRRIVEQTQAKSVFLYGETLGVQDLLYGLQKGQIAFRAFDLRINREFISNDDFQERMSEHGIPTVPLVYQGSWDRETLETLAVGSESMTGSGTHIREGLVVKPVIERGDATLGRVIVKMISPDYLTRKGNATEYE
jgi:RNA ligase (TIGR02306 family)